MHRHPKILASLFVIASAAPYLRADVFYTDPAAFAAATTNPTVVGFNGILTGQPFEGFSPLNVGGNIFATPNPGTNVNVTTADFYTPADYPADFIIDSANAGPDNELDITFANPTYAVALDYGAFIGGGLGTITLSDGFVFQNPSLPGTANTDFVGFVSSTPLTGLSFVTTGDSWVLLDMTLATAPEPTSVLLLGTLIAAFGLVLTARARRERARS